MVHTELTAKRFDHPDETHTFVGDSGHSEVVHLGERTASRSTFRPGWRWSDHIRPEAGTERCEMFHLGYVLSGRMRIAMHGGSVVEIGPGDAFEIPPDHDAEVIGESDCVLIDFGDMAEFVAHHS
jgi:quercetin dioxygenase-like cupin family protein